MSTLPRSGVVLGRSHRADGVKRGAQGATVFRDGPQRTIGTPPLSIPKHEPVRPVEPRYRSTRWGRVRKAVLARDGYRCRIVAGCPAVGNTCDHIEPVYPGMPDSLFYDPRNLRAGCREHNLARGHAAKLEPRRVG